MKKFFALFFVLVLFIYFATSGGNTPYNYFIRLADAFLHGRLYLTQAPSWLSELLPLSPGKWYVVYPPMPAVVAMPLVWLFGTNFPQQYIAHFVGSLIAITTVFISLKIDKDKRLATWSGLLVGLGTIVWYMSSVGSVWYLGQTMAYLFMNIALLLAQKNKNSFLVGALLGAAYLSRLPTIITAPFFLLIVLDINSLSPKKIFTKQNIYKTLLFVLGVFPFILINAAYDFVRFGVFWNQGYFLLPQYLHETSSSWFANGVMNLSYVPESIRAAFWSFPKITSSAPFVTPRLYALSIWITTPAFIFSFFAPIREFKVKIAWISVIAVFLFDAMHGGVGWAQFGYRFALDFYPILVFLTIKGVSKKKLTKIHWALLFLSIAVNLWGVVFINKLGYASF